MSETLDRLVGATGDVRRLLPSASADEEGYVDLSKERWDEFTRVLKGLSFKRIKFRNVEMRPNLVGSTFEDCLFDTVRSEDHFWGADDQWTNCVFRSCNLKGMISPRNSFVGCEFADTKLTSFGPCETLFEECTFRSGLFEGMRAAGDTTFRRCKFEKTRFLGCWFGSVRFESCEFLAPRIESCDFTGATSTPKKWWSDQQSSDPFLTFIDEVVALVTKKLGPDHRMIAPLRAFKVRYMAGGVDTREIGPLLMPTDLSEADLDLIDRPIDRLIRKFGIS